MKKDIKKFGFKPESFCDECKKIKQIKWMFIDKKGGMELMLECHHHNFYQLKKLKD